MLEVSTGGVMTVKNESINRLEQELLLWENGITRIAGIDEVGRGCLFGPVVAAAVILPPQVQLPDVKDSKKLSEKQRERLYDEIIKIAVSYSVSIISVDTIEQINIKQASRLAMKEAVLKLGVKPEWLLIDAETIDLEFPQTSLIKGDDRSQTIAAASILAKVTRDHMAADWDQQFPGYGLKSNKGYSSPAHWAGLERLGPTPMHRPTFLRKWSQRQLSLFDDEPAAAREEEF